MFSIELKPSEPRMQAPDQRSLTHEASLYVITERYNAATAIGSLNKRKRCLFIPSTIFLVGWDPLLRSPLEHWSHPSQSWSTNLIEC